MKTSKEKLTNKIVKKFSLFIRIISGIALIILIISFFVRHDVPSQDVVTGAFVLIAIVLELFREFMMDWSPLFIFFYTYEFFRGHANIIQSALNISVHQSILLRIDQFFFGNNIPVIITQSLIQTDPTIIDYIAFFWYTSFFWVPILTGFILWFKHRPSFKLFRNAYVFLCTFALITFILFPTSPPWMASQNGLLPHLVTNTWGRLWFGSITLGIFNTVGYNPVAAFPSLHVGWAFLSAFFYDRFFNKRLKIFSKLFYLYPIIMCFVVTYTSDHYIIDMLAGVIYAIISIYIAYHLKEIKEKMQIILKPFIEKASKSINYVKIKINNLV